MNSPSENAMLEVDEAEIVDFGAVAGSSPSNLPSTTGTPSNSSLLEGLLVAEEDDTLADTGLADFLKQNARGKEILREYKANNQFLRKRTRSKLVRLVIQREKDWQMRNISADEQLDRFNISKKRFIILAHEIARIFEKEEPATYYSPHRVENKIEIPITGKLWDHFNYEKLRLREVGLLATKYKKKQKKPLHTINEQEAEKLEWLKTNIDDWTTVENYWKETFQSRRSRIVIEKQSPQNIFDSYACLSIQKGIALIKYDFEQLYPNINIISEADWIQVKSCLVIHFKQAENITLQDQGLLHCLLANTIKEDKEDLVIFHLLPYIITSQRPTKRKRPAKASISTTTVENQENALTEASSSATDSNINFSRPHKLSIKERFETFNLQIPTPADLQLRIEELQKKLKRLGQPFQPLVVAIGETLEISEYFVVINQQFYKQNNCLAAIDLAFKIFFVFDCAYPENSLTLWLFVQKCLFNLNLPTDSNNVSLNVLLGYIRKTLLEK